MSHRVRVQQVQKSRRAAQLGRDRQVRALHPHLRTFELVSVHMITGAEGDDAPALPSTITLVTPDHDDPARDHLFVGSHPVVSGNHEYDADFRELTFTTSNGSHPVHGHLRLTHSRTRAHGSIDYAGRCFAVEYAVKPQRYRMKLGAGAAYTKGTATDPSILWDVTSARWTDAPWTKDYELDFTYGVQGEEIVGGEVLLTFVAWFDDTVAGRRWEPLSGNYAGHVDAKRRLTFRLQSGDPPKASGDKGRSVFPRLLRVDLSEFGEDFVGGMVIDIPDPATGTCHGVQGVWARAQAGGLYVLNESGESAEPRLVLGVHDGVLHFGDTPIPSSTWDGSTLAWDGLPEVLAGLPESGHLEFSLDGHRVVDSSLGLTGERTHPDRVAELDPALHGSSAHTAALCTAAAGDADHSLTALLNMSQFVCDENNRYYDRFQKESMQDFYGILQKYMNPDYRDLLGTPPPLDQEVDDISKVDGTKGGKAAKWYDDLSTAYVSSTLAQWSSDPAAKTLNGKRANAWVRQQTAISDVMAAHGPLLYAHRYRNVHRNLDWFLNDQLENAEKYAPAIDTQVNKWVEEIRAETTGKPEEIQKLVDQMKELGEQAKQHKQYWAFVVYTANTKTSYLNLLKTIVTGGDEIDGSEFTQRVQRTVALLNVLDTSSHFSRQYGYLLQLFQLAHVLPQLMDYSQNIDDFSYAVKQIIDQFVKDHIDSPDPKMKEAAEELRQHASEKLCGDILQVLRASSATIGGLTTWNKIAAEFDGRVAQFFGKVPIRVTRLIAVGAVGLLINYFVSGKVKWTDLPTFQQISIITNGAGIVAQVALKLVQRGVAFGELFDVANGFRSNLRLFFSSNLLTDVQQVTSTTFKTWLMNSGTLRAKAWDQTALAELAENARIQAQLSDEAARLTTLGKIFGQNLDEFLATRLGSALAIVGIVTSAIALAHGGEPMEKAANSLFLASSTLELISTAGAWAIGAVEVAEGVAMTVSSILAVVSVIGMVAMVAGAVLMLIIAFRPTASPIRTFAEKHAGLFYMPKGADIEYFQAFQIKGEAQRSGIWICAEGDPSRSLYIGADGALKQGTYDGTGNTAFYLRTDESGRVQIGAPVVDDKGKQALYLLALDDSGKLVAQRAGADTTTNAKMLWHAEILSEGGYEQGEAGQKFLKSAKFRLHNIYWQDERHKKRYVCLDGTAGWTATDDQWSELVFTMVTTKPGTLKMNDIVWHTNEHDLKQGPVLTVPGSAPRTWKLTPALPSGLDFSTETGVISMKKGVDQAALAKTLYELTVTNTAGSSTAAFSIQIDVPAKLPLSTVE